MKCPKCNAECWRDEHPDGIAFGEWACTVCDWFEPTKYTDLTGLEEENDLF